MGPFPSPLKVQAFHVWDVIADSKYLNNLQIWPSLVCYLRKLTMILFIGSTVNINTK